MYKKSQRVTDKQSAWKVKTYVERYNYRPYFAL